jgi:hypothetical protein
MLRLVCVLLLVAAASPAARAELRPHPDNPRYFLETRTGKAVLIASHGNIAPTSGEIDYVAEIARNSTHGMHYARVWHWLPWDKVGAFWPWTRRMTPEAGMGGGRYDLDTWNPEYWRRVKDGIARCAKAGIYTEIMLFEACGMKEAPTRWRRNPWASDNNVNGLELPDSTAEGIPTFYDFASRPNLRRQQERYLRKMVDETIAYPNVIYEIENEHVGGYEPQWSRHYSRFVKDYIASRYPASPRLVSNSSDAESCFNAPNIDIVNYHSDSTDLDSYNRFLEGHWPRGKAMNVDELANGQTSYDALRRVCWTIVVSGGHFHIEDAAPSAKPYEVAQNVLMFCKAAQWDFVRAAPNRRLIASGDGYCMEQSGVEYVCFFPTGGTKTVILAPGRYTARWWNPRSGGLSSGDDFDHSGGDRPFRTPDSGDWVLHVKRAGARAR